MQYRSYANKRLADVPPVEAGRGSFLPLIRGGRLRAGLIDPARRFDSASPHLVRRSRLHSASPVCVRAGKAPYSSSPSSSPNRTRFAGLRFGSMQRTVFQQFDSAALYQREKTRSGRKFGLTPPNTAAPALHALPYHPGQGSPPAAFRCLSSAGGGPGSPEAPGPVKGAPPGGVSHAPTGRRRHPRYTGPPEAAGESGRFGD